MYKLIFSFAVLLFVAPVQANIFESELLRNSRVVYEAQPRQAEYRIVRSSLKKINGRWVADREDIVEGMLQRQTFELDGLLSYREARSKLKTSLKDTFSNQIVFSCDGLDCGSSNAWANEVLKIKQLYGLDNYQYYAVAKSGNKTWVFYLVQRGNRRTYLQVDQISHGSATLPANLEQAIQTSLTAQGYWIIGDASSFYRPDQSQNLADFLTPLRNYLQQNPQIQVTLVGHAYEQGSTEMSKSYATEIKTWLTDNGIASNRLSVFGAGSYSPRQNAPASRVEVVAIQGE